MATEIELPEGKVVFEKPEEILWKKVLNAATDRLKAAQDEIIVEEAIIELAKQKLQNFKAS